MIVTPISRFVLVFVTGSLAIAGFGGGADSIGAKSAELSQEPLVAAQDSTQPRATITTEFLLGAWCYRYYSSGGDVKEKNINHVFREDGSMLFQNNARSQMNRIGDWSIDGDALIIDPTLAAFRTTIKSADQDKFVLTGMVEHTFTRGSCGVGPA